MVNVVPRMTKEGRAIDPAQIDSQTFILIAFVVLTVVVVVIVEPV